MRASDRDRDKVAGELRQHWVDGRIEVEEFDQRLAGVLAAQTIRELAELTYDLPSPPAQVDNKPRRVRVGPPGMLPFTERIAVPASPAQTVARAIETIAPALNAYGYTLTEQTSEKLVFERAGRPGWALLVAVLAFPVGLLALLVRRTHTIAITVEAASKDRAVMVVHGSAPRRVRKAFAHLRFS